jgi:hypothetical protein
LKAALKGYGFDSLEGSPRAGRNSADALVFLKYRKYNVGALKNWNAPDIANKLT